jgi:hypothetical protein
MAAAAGQGNGRGWPAATGGGGGDPASLSLSLCLCQPESRLRPQYPARRQPGDDSLDSEPFAGTAGCVLAAATANAVVWRGVFGRSHSRPGPRRHG